LLLFESLFAIVLVTVENQLNPKNFSAANLSIHAQS